VFYLPDVQGNSRGLLNGSQAATDGYNWDAFGTLMSRNGGNPTAFAWGEGSGYQTDNDTGLVLMGHRYYDTRIGRFLSQDPAGSGDNWYAYADNDPMDEVDPDGLMPQDGPGSSPMGVDMPVWMSVSNIESYTSASLSTLGLGHWDHGSPTGSVDGQPTNEKGEQATNWVMNWDGISDALGWLGPEFTVVKTDPHQFDHFQIGATLYRFGADPESAEQLGADAAKAEAHPEFKIFGVSVLSKQPAKYPDAPSASWEEVAKHFKIHKTGKNPFHYTVELPKPVTEATAKLFNIIFKRL